MRKWCVFFCMVFLSLAVVGCGGKEEQKAEEKPITITDMTGRKVTLPHKARTYALSTFDLIDFVIPLKKEQAFSMLVGVGDSGGKKSFDRVYEAKFPEWKAQWTVISPHASPFDVEAILAKKPDVLIVNSAMQAHQHALEIEPRLKEAGIALVLIDVPRTSGLDTSVQEAYRLFGEIFGEQEKAAEVNAFLDKQFADVRACKEKAVQMGAKKPLVYYEKSGSMEVYGPSSVSKSIGWGAVIAYAGGENLADRATGGKMTRGGISIDPELVVTSRPDVIILSGGGNMGIGVDKDADSSHRFDIVGRPGWSTLPAVERKEVYEFQHELSRTPMLFYSMQSLMKIFYPEASKELDPESRLEEFYKRFMLISKDEGIWQVKMP